MWEEEEDEEIESRYRVASRGDLKTSNGENNSRGRPFDPHLSTVKKNKRKRKKPLQLGAARLLLLFFFLLFIEFNSGMVNDRFMCETLVEKLR